MKNFLLLLLFLVVLNSCKNNSELKNSEIEVSGKNSAKMDDLKWLLGTWTNTSEGSFSQETWSAENDSTYTAFSFTEIDGKTVFAETMALEKKKDSVFLTVAKANQNDPLPVTFKLISSEKGQFIFENKNHDFPERIFYTNPSKDSIHAWIEGTVNGEAKKVDFYFSRKK